MMACPIRIQHQILLQLFLIMLMSQFREKLLLGGAVTQNNNQDKTAVTVSWRAPNTGKYFFRATFVENFETFWARKDISPPTTTTTSTTSTSSTPFTTTSASALTTVTSVPVSMLQPDPTTVTEVTSLVPTSTTDPATSVRSSTQGISSTDTTVASIHALYSASTQLSDPTTITEVTSLVSTSTTDPTTSTGASTQGFSSTDTTVASTHALHSASTQLSHPTTITEVTSLVPTSTTHPTTSLGMSAEGFSSTDTTVTSTHAPHSASTQLSDPTTITEDTCLVLTSTADPTTSTVSTSAKSDLSVCKTGSDWFLILLLASYLSLVEGFPFLMEHRKRRNVVVMQVSSVLSLLFSLVAFIILLILTELVAAKVLTGLAVFLSLCQIIVIFSFHEPSHQLRRHLCWVFGLVAFANICVTTAAIFVGLVQWKVCLWLPIVMAAYLACDNL
ncbi:cell wall protein DAN4-like isoform X2 [Colossoma macropomum]|uniref:cell wall protein DAN4-like isoform X2 n=1 Tax=Colossoma macropomum TaxID=42526 RepID=UPI0018648355|nr:cell wall protein DAN4-like isoform X2 [Colossoma macropomum]